MGDTDIADKGKRKNEDGPRAIFNKFSFQKGTIWLVFILHGMCLGVGCSRILFVCVCCCMYVVHGHLSARWRLDSSLRKKDSSELGVPGCSLL